ncbi:MAG: penicillin-binding protein activator LpoB [Helicobacteraceae bacterium]|jgi:uncharacterized protein (TIGR02722 family)|nr:penicillin-binding protein activator LpoB [Helicobacteraceae bacterium]
MRRIALIGATIFALIFIGCSTKVTRLDTSEVVDLSGDWNDVDSRQTSEELIKSMLNERWLPAFYGQYKTKPVLTVGEIKNLSHEHINTQTFMNDIQRAVINSGDARFIASRDDRLNAREERKEQDQYAKEETRKKERQEIGADFIVNGTINTIIDSEGKTAVKYYQIDLTLTSVESQEIVWSGGTKIKKLVENKKVRP